ncbi:MAG: transglycosylase SLT domain-containing protein [Bacteroidales bacterium]|jgi:membrane-bound lytic murein transglycosylase D|nr:transglycosylase SLT domain-containing protein [Bacteroidales bacterium]
MMKELFRILILSLILLPYITDQGYSANQKTLNRNYPREQSSKKPKKDSIPIFPDLVYEYKIAKLNHLTPIELEYNERVRRYIDVYTIERREHLARIIGLAELYFPIFEEMLDKYGLPLELKYLAIVESALDPRAVSSSAAVGLWQFKINTSRMFDLEVNSYIDERSDPYRSTEAACAYLQYLYRIYNDWQLALAAYNGGPGVVRNAIIRSGGKTNFWEIEPYLPDQTNGYVPAFIAVNYVMNHYKEHNIEPIRSPYIHMDIDTITIHQATSFKRIAEFIDLPVEALQFLNPVYKLDYIPELENGATVVLPANKIRLFLKNEEAILDSNTNPKSHPEEIAFAGDKNGKTKIIHEVTKGEYFHKIAIKYNCTIEDIKIWNSLPTNDLQVGQKLNIWVDPTLAQRIEEEKLLPKQQRDSTDRFIYYIVREGDTIWSIAEKFNCRSITELKEENKIDDEKDLKPGVKLKIYLNN